MVDADKLLDIALTAKIGKPLSRRLLAWAVIEGGDIVRTVKLLDAKQKALRDAAKDWLLKQSPGAVLPVVRPLLQARRKATRQAAQEIVNLLDVPELVCGYDVWILKTPGTISGRFGLEMHLPKIIGTEPIDAYERLAKCAAEPILRAMTSERAQAVAEQLRRHECVVELRPSRG